MKKIIIMLLSILITSSCFCQEIQNQKKSILSREDYLRKSKNQKTAAIILGLGGTASVITGGAIMLSDFGKGMNRVFSVREPNPQPLEESNGVGPGLVIFGAVAILTAIPLSIASVKNKKHAMSVSMKNEIIPGRRPEALSLPVMPVASLNIKF